MHCGRGQGRQSWMARSSGGYRYSRTLPDRPADLQPWAPWPEHRRRSDAVQSCSRAPSTLSESEVVSSYWLVVRVAVPLNRGFTFLFRADANRFIDRRNKNLSVANLAGLGRADDRLHGGFDAPIGQHEFEF